MNRNAQMGRMILEASTGMHGDIARDIAQAWCNLAEQKQEMQSRIEALEKDAARWRHARDNFDMQSDEYLWIETDSGQRIHVQSWAKHENERAIDTAMQSEKEGV